MVSSPMPLVSVVILTYNRKEQLCNLLHALREQDYDPFEVIVVDNASTDGTDMLIAHEFPEVRLIRSPQNQGNYSYSFGVQAARGTYLTMIDDDGLPGSLDWIRQVVQRLEANPRLAAAACTVRMQDTGRIAPDSPQFVPEGDLESGYPCAAYNGTGVGLRAKAAKDLLPIYPHTLFRSWIELYFCTRLLQAGWEVCHFPDLEVWHCRPSGTSNPPLAYYGLRNYLWYVWALYPQPFVTTETLHYLGSCTKLMLQGKVQLRLLWRASIGFVKNLRHIKRTPVSRSVVVYLRWIRRHGNWHGIAPEIVLYDHSKALPC